MNNRYRLKFRAEHRFGLEPLVGTLDEGQGYRRLVFVKKQNLDAARKKYGDRLCIWWREKDDWD